MDAEQFEIVWWWHFAELAVWIMLLVMFRRWSAGESKAERQRNEIRERLMNAMDSVVETQNVFLAKIVEMDCKLDALAERK